MHLHSLFRALVTGLHRGLYAAALAALLLGLAGLGLAHGQRWPQAALLGGVAGLGIVYALAALDLGRGNVLGLPPTRWSRNRLAHLLLVFTLGLSQAVVCLGFLLVLHYSRHGANYLILGFSMQAPALALAAWGLPKSQVRSRFRRAMLLLALAAALAWLDFWRAGFGLANLGVLFGACAGMLVAAPLGGWRALGWGWPVLQLVAAVYLVSVHAVQPGGQPPVLVTALLQLP